MKLITLITVLTFGAGLYAQPAGYNYDESKVPEYKLPEVLKLATGRTVMSVSQWQEKRRPEVMELFRKHE